MLLQLTIEPSLARAGTILDIELLTSGSAAELPSVTVAGQAATAFAQSGSGAETTRYAYRYQVEGAEDEGVVTVRAVARMGRNQETLERQITLDFTPPTIIDLSGPEQSSPVNYAAFTFGCSENGCSFACLMENQAGEVISELTSCESGVSYHNLAPGNFSFSVRATDPAGNEGEPAFWQWTVQLPPSRPSVPM